MTEPTISMPCSHARDDVETIICRTSMAATQQTPRILDNWIMTISRLSKLVVGTSDADNACRLPQEKYRLSAASMWAARVTTPQRGSILPIQQALSSFRAPEQLRWRGPLAYHLTGRAAAVIVPGQARKTRSSAAI